MEIRKVFHAGERAFQESLGLADRMAEIGGQVIRPFMPEQHREFFEGLAYLFVGALDAAGRPWASVVIGETGFIRSETDAKLAIRGMPSGLEELGLQMSAGDQIGILGLDLTNRRRNRVNGTIEETGPGSFGVAVAQSFGNCPKYIQTRAVRARISESSQRTGSANSVERFEAFQGETADMIRRNDCFFIASAFREADRMSEGDSASDTWHDATGIGVDVSHRGGRPGFITIENKTTISFDDYPGNMFFNTLGNLLLNPTAGFLFIDFASGDLYLCNGTVTIHNYAAADIKSLGRGKILRKVSFELTEGYRIPGNGAMQWPVLEYSPALPE